MAYLVFARIVADAESAICEMRFRGIVVCKVKKPNETGCKAVKSGFALFIVLSINMVLLYHILDLSPLIATYFSCMGDITFAL